MRRIFLILEALLITVATLHAGYKVDIGLTVGEVENADTIWAGEYFSFDFNFENDDTLSGYSTGYTIWSDDGADWEFAEAACFPIWVPGPMIFCCNPTYHEAVPGSRQDPLIEILDNGGLQVTMADMDGAPRDTFLFSGTRKDHGVYPGPLEKQIRFFLIATVPGDGSVSHICIDSTKVGSAGDYVFSDVAGGAFAPEVLWPRGGRCWPVKKYDAPGDVNVDYSVNIGDAVYLGRYVFQEGPAPAASVNADVNDDCSVNVADIVYLINFIFHEGITPQPGCLPPPPMPYPACE